MKEPFLENARTALQTASKKVVHDLNLEEFSDAYSWMKLAEESLSAGKIHEAKLLASVAMEKASRASAKSQGYVKKSNNQTLSFQRYLFRRMTHVANTLEEIKAGLPPGKFKKYHGQLSELFDSLNNSGKAINAQEWKNAKGWAVKAEERLGHFELQLQFEVEFMKQQNVH